VHLFVAHDLRTEKRRKSLYVKKNVGVEKNKICWKYMSLTSPQTREKKKKGEKTPFHSMKRLLIGCMEIFIPNIGRHYFWPRLLALPKNTQEHPNLFKQALAI
jgi:hypothetical protein